MKRWIGLYCVLIVESVNLGIAIPFCMKLGLLILVDSSRCRSLACQGIFWAITAACVAHMACLIGIVNAIINKKWLFLIPYCVWRFVLMLIVAAFVGNLVTDAYRNREANDWTYLLTDETIINNSMWRNKILLPCGLIALAVACSCWVVALVSATVMRKTGQGVTRKVTVGLANKGVYAYGSCLDGNSRPLTPIWLKGPNGSEETKLAHDYFRFSSSF